MSAMEPVAAPQAPPPLPPPPPPAARPPLAARPSILKPNAAIPRTTRRRRGGRPRRKEPVLMGRMTYRWSVKSKPAGSRLRAGTIAGVRSPIGWFKPDVAGVYVLSLHTRGHGAMYVDDVKIRVLADGEDPPPLAADDDDGFVWAHGRPVVRSPSRSHTPESSPKRAAASPVSPASPPSALDASPGAPSPANPASPGDLCAAKLAGEESA